MKRALFLVAVSGLTACEFYYYDPVYNPVDRVTGSYQVEEYSETYNDVTNYSIWIGRGYGSNEIYIDNFYAVDIRVYASLSYDKITIYRQTVDGYVIEGTGTIYDDQISFTYSVKDIVTGSRTDFCESTAWRDY